MMRSKLLVGGLAVAVAFLLATNPVVAEAAKQITGSQIRNNSVASSDIKNNSLTGKDVKSNSLKGSDLKDGSLTGDDNLVRVASAAADTSVISDTTEPAVAATVAILAPADGYLVINAGSDVLNYADPDLVKCYLQVDGVYVPGSNRFLKLSGGNEEEDCTSNGTRRVPAGIHTVSLIGDPNAESTAFLYTSLDVLFVPFGQTGGPPAKPGPVRGPAEPPAR